MWLRGVDESKEPPPAPVRVEEEARVARGPKIRCRACRSVVTDAAARVEAHGAHTHRRVNPSGVDFHVGCFEPAPGCITEGAPTLYWTWFPGCAWQLALCRACHAHLGWRFTGEQTFWGLILDRLVEDQVEDD
ncbi:MAG TPA: hypothetical protein DEF51_15335 [Myxococcales bacterium]|nr:hypothetical protein [Myxococcales bacterium]